MANIIICIVVIIIWCFEKFCCNIVMVINISINKALVFMI